MRILFAGTPDPAVPSLRTLLSSRHEVLAVVTRPDAPAGRGRGVQQSPVKRLAVEAGVEVLQPVTPRDPAFVARLGELAPDACPVVAYGALIPGEALALPSYGWINLHFSLLPAWRGAAPVQHAVLHGDEVTGASTFRLEEGLDTGPVFGVVTETIRPGDTSGDLLERLSEAGARLLLATLDGLEDGTLTAVPQPAEGVSLAPKISVADVEVDFATPALHVDRLVRAATPAPGAWTTFTGRRLKLAPVTVATEEPRLAPGELRRARDEVLVGTSTAPVRLGQLKPEGKGWMVATAWANGLRLTGDERLGG